MYFNSLFDKLSKNLNIFSNFIDYLFDAAHVNGTSCEFDAIACLLSMTIY